MNIAFFDVDGTLLPYPSLERRFFRELRYRRKIPVANYLRWAARLFHLGAEGSLSIQSNKMYLQGVCPGALCELDPARARRWMPAFFPAAIQRIFWHSRRGDTIVLVTGTLSPLAELVQLALGQELLRRGVEPRMAVIATKLEVRDHHWTGRVAGLPMFGKEKARSVAHFASSRGIALEACSAYGDHLLDRWMLAAVAHPFAVNPSPGLRRIATRHYWNVLIWNDGPPPAVGVRTSLKEKDATAR